jgi:hypothetical protein
MKYSKIAGVTRWSGGTTLLRKGQSADEDHGLVKERPDLFTDVAPGASLAAGHKVPPPAVERATRAPGEVRVTESPSTRAIREWAVAAGFEVAARGKLSPEVVEAYNAAHEPVDG